MARGGGRRYLGALGLVLAALGSSCSRPLDDHATSGQPESRRGGILVIASNHDFRGVNPLVGSHSTFSRAVLDQMFLHLMEEQPDYTEHPPTMAPRLAQSWQWSADHRTLTLQLRPGVRWNDGTPVSAEDVRWTWQAQTHPEVAWGYADMKESITAVEAVDPLTVRVAFDKVSSSQLTDLNEGAILPKHRWSRLPFSEWQGSSDWFLDNLVVDGPFALDSWNPQEEISLRRNDHYHKENLPYVDRVVIRIIPQKSNQIQQLLSGEVDFVDHLPAAEGARIRQAEGVEILDFWHRQYDFICWNLANPLFAEREIRQALTQAIDRQSIIDALWFGYARISTSPIISSVWAHHRDIRPWPYDPAEASRILRDQGWRDTDGDGVLDRRGRKFSFELSTNADSQLRVDAAVMIQEQLRRIGIEARVRRMELNTLIDKNLAHEFDATIGAWGIDTSLDLTYAFHSDSIDNGYNFGAYSVPQVDRLIVETKTVSDPAQLFSLVKQIQARLHEDQPYTFLWEPRRLIGVSQRLQNAQPNPLSSFFHLEEWWLLPPTRQ